MIADDAGACRMSYAKQVKEKTLESITYFCKHGPADLRDRKATAQVKVSHTRDRAVDVRGSCKRGCPCTFVAKKKQAGFASSSGETSTVWEIRYFCTQHENHLKAEVQLNIEKSLIWVGFLHLVPWL